MSNNPFEIQKSETSKMSNPVAMSDEARAVQEVQAAMVIAKRFKRDPIEATDRILTACTRPTLADGALYEYSRGGTKITGPSIRLAEAIAQAWGNVSFGMRELSNDNGQSVMETFAWDLETNTKQVKVFTVKHYRHTKKGGYDLTDPRDIYEMVANQGARRLRACVLGIIPGDVIEAAVKQCEETLTASVDMSPEAIKRMVSAFTDLGVTKKMIEARIQCRLGAIRPAQVLTMRKIYNSIKDGMSSPEDWFDMALKAENDLNDMINQETVDTSTGEIKPDPSNKKQVDERKPEQQSYRTRPKVIEAFKKEIDAIEHSLQLDRWRSKHAKRVARELPKPGDQDAVFAYAQEHYLKLLQADEKEPMPPHPADQVNQQRPENGAPEMIMCPHGMEVVKSDCQGCDELSKCTAHNADPGCKLTMDI